MGHNAFHEATEAILLPRVVALGGRLFGASFTLMKLVPARHILLAALQRGELEPDTVVVETTSGTFGLALAMQCALLDRRLVLVGDPAIAPPLERRLADLGAEVVICPEPDPVTGYQGARLRRVDQIRAGLASSYQPDQYANPLNPDSYALVGEHLAAVLGSVDCVVGPVGSGGSMCGTVRALRAAGHRSVAVGVDTQHSVLFGAADGPRTLRGLGNSLLPPNLDHSVFDEVHWCDAGTAHAGTRALHRRHALFQGPTSGAAYLAARDWSDRHPDATCVVMLPDEGHRYMDTVYDDQWLNTQGISVDDQTLDRLLRLGPVEVAGPRSCAPGWSRMAWGRLTLQQVLDGAPLGRVG